jgi:hypothetical protein
LNFKVGQEGNWSAKTKVSEERKKKRKGRRRGKGRTGKEKEKQQEILEQGNKINLRHSFDGFKTFRRMEPSGILPPRLAGNK